MALSGGVKVKLWKDCIRIYDRHTGRSLETQLKGPKTNIPGFIMETEPRITTATFGEAGWRRGNSAGKKGRVYNSLCSCGRLQVVWIWLFALNEAGKSSGPLSRAGT